MSLATVQISLAAHMSLIVVLKNRLRVSSKSTILVHIAWVHAVDLEYRRLQDRNYDNDCTKTEAHKYK